MPFNLIERAIHSLATSSSYATAEDLIKEMGWRETARDRVRIQKDIDLVLDQNPKLLKKCKKSEKAFAPLLKILAKNSGDQIDLKLASQMMNEEIAKRIQNMN